jgi:hypothetical protein
MIADTSTPACSMLSTKAAPLASAPHTVTCIQWPRAICYKASGKQIKHAICLCPTPLTHVHAHYLLHRGLAETMCIHFQITH